MSVYIFRAPLSPYLEHHGVKGQKWGVRRYRNYDGSLTAEGRRMLGLQGGTNRADNKSGLRRFAEGDSLLGANRMAIKTEGKLYDKIQDRLKKGQNVKSLMRQYEKLQVSNLNREAYMSTLSTGQLLTQRILLGERMSYLVNDMQGRRMARRNSR